MKRILIILGVVVILSLLLFLLFWNRDTVLKFDPAKPFAIGIEFPESVKEDVFRFFNGSRFVEYDLSSRQSSALGRIVRLPTVTDVTWTSGGVAFRAVGSTPADELYPILEAGSFDPQQQYWWLFEFATGSLTLVATGSSPSIGNVVWNQQSENLLFAAQKPGSDQLALYSLTYSGQPKEIGENDSVTNPIWWDNDSVLFQTYQGISRAPLSDLSQAEDIVETGRFSGQAVASRDGTLLVYAKTNTTFQRTGETTKTNGLVLYNTQTATATTIQPDFNGTFSLTSEGDILAIAEFGEDTPLGGFVYNPGTQKRTNFVFSDSDGLLSSEMTQISKDPLSLLAIERGNEVNSVAYLVSTSPSQAKGFPVFEKSDVFSQGKNVYKDGYYVAYFPDAESYSVYVTSGNFEARQQEALSYFESLGIDPNLITIRWYPPELL